MPTCAQGSSVLVMENSANGVFCFFLVSSWCLVQMGTGHYGEFAGKNKVRPLFLQTGVFCLVEIHWFGSGVWCSGICVLGGPVGFKGHRQGGQTSTEAYGSYYTFSTCR